MGASAVTLATPWAGRAQTKTIKLGMPTILSIREARLALHGAELLLPLCQSQSLHEQHATKSVGELSK
jgi:hypothetical protein